MWTLAQRGLRRALSGDLPPCARLRPLDGIARGRRRRRRRGYAIAWRRQRDIPRRAELGWLVGVTRRVRANTRRSRRRAGALHALLDLQRARPGPIPPTTGDDELRAALMTLDHVRGLASASASRAFLVGRGPWAVGGTLAALEVIGHVVRRASRPRATRSMTRRRTRSTNRRPARRRASRRPASPATGPCRPATPPSPRSGSCCRRAGWRSAARAAQRRRRLGDLAEARSRPARVDAVGVRRRRQAAGAARSRPRRERAAAGHPLVGLRGAARRRCRTSVLTLTGAHPSARVVRDAARAETADGRMHGQALTARGATATER